MMAPQDHQQEYAKSSAFLKSAGLADHLMIIHGMRDEIVLFQDSISLEQRLILEGKDVQVVALPNAPHSWDTGPMMQTRFAYHQLITFFQRLSRRRTNAVTTRFALAFICTSALAQTCTHTVGMVASLTGPAGRFGQAASKAVELAFQELNKAAGTQGIAGCKLALDLRDDQSQGSIGVDQARQLVDLKKVPVIIGSVISSVTVPIVTSVTAPMPASVQVFASPLRRQRSRNSRCGTRPTTGSSSGRSPLTRCKARPPPSSRSTWA